MWLTGRLSPDFKTLADFRADNGKAIRGVCRAFIVLCRRLGMFTQSIVAIDGSKFKAVNHRDRNFTSGKMKMRMELIEQSINEYLEHLDRMDRKEAPRSVRKAVRLKDRIVTLKQEMQRLKGLQRQMEASADGQVSLTDPDARSMASQGKGTGIVGYNVQTAVDAEHHLIVAHEVTNVGSDRDQLHKMAEQAREAMGGETLTAVADRGYFKSQEILACEAAGIVPIVAKSITSTAEANGRFGREAFRYVPRLDEYRCPANQRLSKRTTTTERGLTMYRYWSSNCGSCALKARCTPGTERRVTRWEHEEVLVKMQRRIDRDPKKMQIRRQTVEHPFGTLKAWMGSTHFLTRTLGRVSTEMSLHVLAYNLKRMMKIMGTGPLIAAMQA
jgi:hypothetical protein